MKQSWKIPVICGILMVVFNVIVFALPIYKTPVVLISDIAVVIAIAAQIPISSIAMKKGTTVTSKVYGWPIISVGLRYLAAITACAMIFILISGVTLIFPIWLPIIVYVVLYGAAGIGLIAAESTRNYVEEQDIRHEEKVGFMRKLYAETTTLKRNVTDREMASCINKISEAVRFSDPTNSADVFDIESELYSIFGEIKASVKANDTAAVKGKCAEFQQLLEERNSMCRIAKHDKA